MHLHSATSCFSTFKARAAQYNALTKPRVTQLAVFCAIIGMLLSGPSVPWKTLLGGSLGIWLTASAAFTINCLLEKKRDARMRRTAARPSASGQISSVQMLVFASILGSLGVILLYSTTNLLTVWLTLATFLGYALIYTVLLKPATPQNIVIGGAAGAMPPALGWAAATGMVSADAWLLVLIIFVWTPPHFWALALYRREDYAKAGLPMLPVTHGESFTRLHILLYSLILLLVSLLPCATGQRGLLYGVVALILGVLFIEKAWRLWCRYSDAQARALFGYSIVYLSLLFLAMLVDHYLSLFYVSNL